MITISDEYRLRAGMTPGDASSDVMIQAALDAVEALMNSYTDRVLYKTDMSEVFVHKGVSSIQLKAYPVDVVTKIIGEIGAYHLDRSRGTIFLESYNTDHNVQVTYSGGYDSIPPDLKLAELALFDSVWPLFSGAAAGSSAGIKTIRAGDLSITYDTSSGGAVGGNAIPFIAMNILNSYVRGSV